MDAVDAVVFVHLICNILFSNIYILFVTSKVIIFSLFILIFLRICLDFDVFVLLEYTSC